METNLNIKKFNCKRNALVYNVSFLPTLIVLFTIFTQVIFAQVAPIIQPSGGFQIEGNLKADNPVIGVGDWLPNSNNLGSYVFNNNGTPVDALKSKVIKDDYDSNTDLVFQGSKFNDNPNSWTWSAGKASSKSDINNAMYHVGVDNLNNTWLIVGGDRLSTNGTSYIDFEFLQNQVVRNPSGGFSSVGPDGGRTLNDFVLSMEYSNGGSNANVHFYLWKLVSGQYKYVEQVVPSSVAFAITNLANENMPLGAFGSQNYSPYQFVEAAVNITALFGYVEPCLGLSVNTVIIKTKASDSETAALGDFVEPIPVKFDFGTATISYNANLCQSGFASVIQSGVTGGVFSSSPAGLVINSNNGEINLTESQVGTYTITYSFVTNSCPKSVTTAVTINPLPEAPITASIDRPIVCAEDNGNITLSSTGGSGTILNWYTDNCGGVLVGSGSSISIPSPIVTTTYYVRWENSCGVSTCIPVTVNVSGLITATATGSAQVSCYNANDGEITVTANGGTGAYLYSLNGGTAQNSNVFSGLIAGTYTVDVSDINGCNVTTSAVTISNPAMLTATATGSTQVSCFNGNDGEITVTANGGTGAYNYSLNGGTAQTSNVFSGLIAGTYSIVVSDINGCNVTTSAVTIANPAMLTATSTGSAQVSCYNANDGEITVTANGGTGAYLYSLNGGTAQTSNVFSGLIAGTYSIVVSDINGCNVTTSAVIISNPAMLTATATGSAQVSCYNANDGEITVTANGGTGAYLYSLNGGTAQTSNVFSGLIAGTYTVVVSDINGCNVTTDAVTIANPVMLTATATGSAQVSCYNANDGEITVTANGGTGAYLYSLNGGTAQTSNIFSGLIAGTYTVVVSDINGCNVTAEAVAIANPDMLTATA
ncbi:MAG: hypothetical protein CVU05_10225, partial [Bacteroidetes bacterium HGW-Bacteroidetes-21]